MEESPMAKNGRLGGKAKGERYKDQKRKAIELFVVNPLLELKDIAEAIGMSVGFVSDHTKNETVKALRYSKVFENKSFQIEALTDKQFIKLTNNKSLRLK